MEKEEKIVVFQDKKIRRIWHNEEWYFSVIDVVDALTVSSDARNYWKVLKHRLQEEGSESVTNCNQLKLESSDGKKYSTDCANTKNMFRIIQSIPSKKAEPFKQWLAKVGYERIQEIEDPELAQNRAKEYYELKGYPKSWIDKRLRGIAIRQELTDEWKDREVTTKKEFAILTDEISKATFGKTTGEYKEFKQLQTKNQNLRDHMTDFELIFTMLGEKTTTEITKDRDAQGFTECEDAAKDGGKAAGEARNIVEKRLGKPIVSEENHLQKKKTPKKLT